jgi:chemotaxis protein methyltransferase CheR
MRRATSPSGAARTVAELSAHEFTALRDLLVRVTGISLNDTKRELMRSRLARRLRELGLASYSDYLRHLRERDADRVELREMVNAMTTNKTSFFRESYQFDWLRSEVFPAMLQRARAGGPRRVSVWSAGCSTGAEPYTMAMLLRETFGAGWDFSILASDIDTEVLATASDGEYEDSQLEGLDRRALSRHFLRGRGDARGRYKVRPELRRLITFKQINLISPWSLPTRFDLILCRNVSIYFNRQTQSQVFSRLAAQLHDGGHLMIGHSECLAGMGVPLEPLRGNVYRRAPAAGRAATGPTLPPIGAGSMDAAGAGRELLARLAGGAAVCVYDSAGPVGGLAHVAPGGESADPLGRLLERLRELGAESGRLEAKVVAPSVAVVESLRVALGALGVPLVSQRVVTGGAEIRFSPSARRVRMSPLPERP